MKGTRGCLFSCCTFGNAAFILTRPLGATVGDFLDKPVADGGLALSRYGATGALVAAMLLLVLLLPQRAERLARLSRD